MCFSIFFFGYLGFDEIVQSSYADSPFSIMVVVVEIRYVEKVISIVKDPYSRKFFLRSGHLKRVWLFAIKTWNENSFHYRQIWTKTICLLPNMRNMRILFVVTPKKSLKFLYSKKNQPFKLRKFGHLAPEGGIIIIERFSASVSG